MIFTRSQGESWAPILLLFCNTVDKDRSHPWKVTWAPDNTDVPKKEHSCQFTETDSPLR